MQRANNLIRRGLLKRSPGFGRIDNRGVKQPAYHTHHRLCHWARRDAADFGKTRRCLPGFDEYHKAAVAFLEQ